ncbi:uncharacterized beta-barrel protein YwiB (DUF1934 family) [Enterococcus sp. PF1-24]|uniref:DUF1934 domain-containing protein n=1 Tax=unclassified Enterococcus TaxID=2608891 RepID=UPI002475D56C|nr:MULTISPECIES: DUF1934 domain-containing protein [unclassified Enterococcus]MDH6364776.1 uncharacterized beta-barrel protein YwiB (DUF1934 family) [Enterococcus sp. PFB1-1]MDH6401879.1 uncharacterized beta-barrel protein YwiB (DUF1934 family) [Enterococcus sp. PF1-24]
MDLTKGLDVSIQLRTQVTQAGEQQEFYFEVPGQVVKIGDTLYIRYKEIQEDTQAEVPVTIKILPDGAVQLIRGGEGRMRLKFAYREHLESQYRTLHGQFPITTYTHNIRFSLKDRPVAGKVVVDYDLYSMNQKIGEYQFTLDFTA